ncbi:MAG: hypothetical protein V3S64_07340 [bacterium]
MKKWAIPGFLYLLFVAVGLGGPWLVILKRQPFQIIDLLIYAGAIVALVVAVFMMTLIVARLFFPTYWWLGQIVGKDVFEYDGIYFMGLRLSRVPNRIQRILVGVDDQMRRWDLVYGVIFLVLLVPHSLGFITANRYFEETLPNPVRFSQTLHFPFLSSMPVMREWGISWSPDAKLRQKIGEALKEIESTSPKDNAKRIRLAQLYLLQSFTLRPRAKGLFIYSPGERIIFDQGRGARAANLLKTMAELPPMKRAGWNGSIQTLLGFYHLANGSFQKAAEFSGKAVLEFGDGEESKISRYQILLLAGLTAMITGDGQGADNHLSVILKDERLPKQAHALALELRGDLRQLQGDRENAAKSLDQAMKIFASVPDPNGVARVHLKRAVLALDDGNPRQASEDLSRASQLAHRLGDVFILNMVEQLTLKFRG